MLLAKPLDLGVMGSDDVGFFFAHSVEHMRKRTETCHPFLADGTTTI
jgi:hypothetical protein